jgi:hypothetical protein
MKEKVKIIQKLATSKNEENRTMRKGAIVMYFNP